MQQISNSSSLGYPYSYLLHREFGAPLVRPTVRSDLSNITLDVIKNNSFIAREVVIDKKWDNPTRPIKEKRTRHLLTNTRFKRSVRDVLIISACGKKILVLRDDDFLLINNYSEVQWIHHVRQNVINVGRIQFAGQKVILSYISLVGRDPFIYILDLCDGKILASLSVDFESSFETQLLSKIVLDQVWINKDSIFGYLLCNKNSGCNEIVEWTLEGRFVQKFSPKGITLLNPVESSLGHSAHYNHLMLNDNFLVLTSTSVFWIYDLKSKKSKVWRIPEPSEEFSEKNGIDIYSCFLEEEILFCGFSGHFSGPICSAINLSTGESVFFGDQISGEEDQRPSCVSIIRADDYWIYCAFSYGGSDTLFAFDRLTGERKELFQSPDIQDLELAQGILVVKHKTKQNQNDSAFFDVVSNRRSIEYLKSASEMGSKVKTLPETLFHIRSEMIYFNAGQKLIQLTPFQRNEE